jgi:hypothetical protein
MRILRPIVSPSPPLMAAFDTQVAGRGASAIVFRHGKQRPSLTLWKPQRSAWKTRLGGDGAVMLAGLGPPHQGAGEVHEPRFGVAVRCPQRLTGTISANSPMGGYPKAYNIEMDPHEDLNVAGLLPMARSLRWRP